MQVFKTTKTFLDFTTLTHKFKMYLKTVLKSDLKISDLQIKI